MTCPSCSGHGVFTVKYRDESPDEYAVCLCAAGEPFRVTENNGTQHVPHYQVWAIRQGIDPARVAPMEVLLDDAELAARGFGELPASSAVDAIAAAAKNRGKRVR